MGDAMDSSVSKPFTNNIRINRKEILGKGSSAVVYRGTYKDRKIAVKRIVLEKSLTDEFTSQVIIQHENVLKILAVEHDKDFRYIVLDLCYGSLSDVIFRKPYKGPPLPSKEDAMYQIADGVNCIHSVSLVHLDIKPENILISMKGQIKLADFGSCKNSENGICITSEPIWGTFSWKAPELCPTGDDKVFRISVNADIFSCGCVFFFICTHGVHLFGDMNDSSKVQSNIRAGEQVNKKMFENLPNANVIRQMVEHEPENRGSLLQVMKHLRVPTTTSIPFNMNKNTPHQERQKEQMLALALPAKKEFSRSQDMIFENKKRKVPDNDEPTNHKLHRGANNGLSCSNNRMEGDVDNIGSIDIGKSDCCDNSGKRYTTKIIEANGE